MPKIWTTIMWSWTNHSYHYPLVIYRLHKDLSHPAFDKVVIAVKTLKIQEIVFSVLAGCKDQVHASVNVCNSWPEFNIIFPFSLRDFIRIGVGRCCRLRGPGDKIVAKILTMPTFRSNHVHFGINEAFVTSRQGVLGCRTSSKSSRAYFEAVY